MRVVRFGLAVSLGILPTVVAAQFRVPTTSAELATADRSARVERIREFVDSATVIARAVAIGIDTLHTEAFDPRYRREPAVVFRPLETLRGTVPQARLIFPGTVVDRDDFNPGSVPYTLVRLAGQRGDCEAKEYRLGAEYLFILRPSRRGGITPHWRPLAPFNEQVRGTNDPWVEWVRARVRHSSASPRGA